MKLLNLPKRTINLLKEVKAEMKKVSWPTFKETLKYTFIVLLISIVIALLLGGFDFLFTTLMNKFVL